MYARERRQEAEIFGSRTRKALGRKCHTACDGLALWDERGSSPSWREVRNMKSAKLVRSREEAPGLLGWNGKEKVAYKYSLRRDDKRELWTHPGCGGGGDLFSAGKWHSWCGGFEWWLKSHIDISSLICKYIVSTHQAERVRQKRTSRKCRHGYSNTIVTSGQKNNVG